MTGPVFGGRSVNEARQEKIHSLQRPACSLARFSLARALMGRGLSLVAFTVLGLSLFALHSFRVGPSYDILKDEETYYSLSQSVATDASVSVYGNPFFLHPPAFFGLEGLYIRAFGPAPDMFQSIHRARLVNVGFAALTGIVLYLFAQRVGGRTAGVLAFGLFALDPYVVRSISRNLLEPSAVFWGLLAFYLLASNLPRAGNGRLILVGFLLGISILTKEFMAFSLIVVWVYALTSQRLSVRKALAISSVAVAVYAIYPLGVLAVGEWPLFWSSKTDGLAIFFGFRQVAGFNQPGASFTSALAGNVWELGTSYVLIGAGSIASILLLIRARDDRARFIPTWSLATYAMFGFIVLRGSLEEQFFYLLVIPAILVLAIALSRVLATMRIHAKRVDISARSRAALPLFILSSLLLAVLWNSVVWSRIHTTPDNAYETVYAFARQEIPRGEPLAVGNDIAEVLFADLVVVEAGPVEELQQKGVRYVLVSSKDVAQGYGVIDETTYEWLQSSAETLFRFQGRTHGTLTLFRLDDGQSY